MPVFTHLTKYFVKCLAFSLVVVIANIPSVAQTVLPYTPIDINSPGLSIDSVVTYMRQHLDPSDPGEGRGEAQVEDFARTWKDRVHHNDSSGTNMFQQLINIRVALA